VYTWVEHTAELELAIESADEAPSAYKDLDRVVEVMERPGSRPGPCGCGRWGW
jgi:RNA-splicing ligase RtcB